MMPNPPDITGPDTLPVSYRGQNGSLAGWSAPTPQQTAQPQQSMDLARYWHAIRRRKWVILAVTAVTTLAATYIAIKSPRVYSAYSTVLVNPQQQRRLALNTDMMAAANMNDLETDVTLIRTSRVAQFASDILKKQGYVMPPLLLAGAVTVTNTPGTNLINITSESGDAKSCAAVAEAMGQGFCDYQAHMAQASGDLTEGYLDQELEKARRRLGEAETNLQHFEEQVIPTGALAISHNSSAADSSSAGSGASGRSGHGAETGEGSHPSEVAASSAADSLQTAKDALADALDDQAAAQDRVREFKQKLDTLDRALQNQSTNNVRDNGMVRELQQQLSDKQSQLADAEAQYTDKGVDQYYPGLRQDVARLKQQLGQAVNNLSRGNTVDLDQQQTLNTQLFQAQVDLAAIQPRIDTLRQRVRSYSQAASRQPSLQTQFDRLMRDRDVLERVYTLLLERQQETKISQAASQGDSNLVVDAVVPTAPIRPDRKKDVMIGIILGLLLGSSLALLLEHMDNSVRSWEDVRDSVGLPVLGGIPLSETQPAMVWQEGSRSLAAEAYRMLRSNVNFVSVDAPVKTILVTSAGPGEGKSSTVANLACAMAQDGKRVIIVDADMRKPSQFRLLGGGRHIGLAEVLSGVNTVEEALRESEIPGVWTIPVDKLPPNPAELLSGQRMRDLVARLREMFDIVLIDTPPCLMVTDAAVLVSLADAAIQVIAAGKTTRDAATRAKDTLMAAHGRVVGAVLNRFHAGDGGSYYYYYYYYYGEDNKSSRRKKDRRPKLASRN